MSGMTTLEDMKRLMPNKKNSITQKAVDIINRSASEPEFQGETLAQSAALYENVIKGTRASIPEYLNAIRFCAYVVSNESNYTEAYKRVFYDREFVILRAELETDHPQYAELTSAASRYRRSKLVVDILTASQVPLDLIFAGQRYKAMGVLADVMENGRYDRDRVSAAKELLAATSGPEHMKIELDVGIKEDSAVQQLNDQLAEIVTRQMGMMESGTVSLETLGSLKVIEHEDTVE